MIAKLEFNLNEPDDIRLHLASVHGFDLAMFIWELKHNILRKALKDGLDPLDMVTLINEHIENLGFDIDEIVI